LIRPSSVEGVREGDMPRAYYILESELDVSGDSMCQWDREGEDDDEVGEEEEASTSWRES
jgi:hypothetical protein